MNERTCPTCGTVHPSISESRTKRYEDPDEVFAAWHFIEFGYRPIPSDRPVYGSVTSLRSAFEAGRRFERTNQDTSNGADDV